MESLKKEEDLYAILYISTMKIDYSKEAIKDMLTTFKQYNNKNNISGLLLFYEKNIIQCIEGYKEDLDRLYNNIKNDIRHYNIIKVIDEKIVSRNFSDWDMGFKYLSDNEIFKYLSYDEFVELSFEKLNSGDLHNRKIKIFFKQFLNSFVQR